MSFLCVFASDCEIVANWEISLHFGLLVNRILKQFNLISGLRLDRDRDRDNIQFYYILLVDAFFHLILSIFLMAFIASPESHSINGIVHLALTSYALTGMHLHIKKKISRKLRAS